MLAGGTACSIGFIGCRQRGEWANPASILFATAVPMAAIAGVAVSTTSNVDHGLLLCSPMLVDPERHGFTSSGNQNSQQRSQNWRLTGLIEPAAGRPVMKKRALYLPASTDKKTRTSDGEEHRHRPEGPRTTYTRHMAEKGNPLTPFCRANSESKTRDLGQGRLGRSLVCAILR